MTQPNLESAVGAWVDAHREDVLQLTEALIRFQSEQRVPTGWEKDAQMYVADTMRALNLELEIFEPTEVEEIRRAMGTQRALGSDDFREDIQRRLGRRVAPGRPGRPRKQKPKPGSECNFPLESLWTPQASRHEIAL